jgi:hypothetical protein
MWEKFFSSFLLQPQMKMVKQSTDQKCTCLAERANNFTVLCWKDLKMWLYKNITATGVGTPLYEAFFTCINALFEGLHHV